MVPVGQCTTVLRLEVGDAEVGKHRVVDEAHAEIDDLLAVDQELFATASVVALPENGSTTSSPSLEQAASSMPFGEWSSRARPLDRWRAAA